MSEPSPLRAAIEATRANPALGRSSLVRRLFDYLAESSLEGRSPKESEVAIEVFGRRPDFDASRDAVARVYVHKLRRRLEDIDVGATAGLTIPRGEYRPVLRDAAAAPAETETASAPRKKALVVGLLVATAIVASLGTWAALSWSANLPVAAPARGEIWRAIVADHRPTIIALGDYYIFAETDAAGGPGRLVREYTVNSASDLDQLTMADPERAARYMDLGLSYLPVGSAGALMGVTRALTDAKDVRVLPVSSLTPAMLRDNNIVYVGYLSGLGILRNATFAGSRYSIGETYDDIIDTQTHQRFESGGGVPHNGGTVYADYGYLSTFAGPQGNRFVIIAGTRDAALMQMAQTVVSQSALKDLARAGGKTRAAEALYGIDGMSQINSQINVGGRLIRSAPLDQSAIWRDGVDTRHTFPAG